MLSSRTWTAVAIAAGFIVWACWVLMARDHSESESESWERFPRLTTESSEAARHSVSVPSEVEASPVADLEAAGDGGASQRIDGIRRAEEELYNLSLRKLREDGPITVNRPPPAYPPEAVQLELTGYVLVAYTVSESGTTENLAILASSSPLFEQPALESVRRYTFLPRLSDGQDVATANMKILFTFGESDLASLPDTDGTVRRVLVSPST